MDSMPRPELKTPSAEPAPMPEMGGGMLSPAVMGDAEQFPVLQAFQKYIEEERERARRRVVIVSASAIVAIVLIVAVFLVVGAIVVGNLMRRNDQLVDAVLANSGRGAAPVVVQTVPQAVGPTAEAQEEAQKQEAKLAALEKANQYLVEQMKGLQSLPESIASQMSAAVSDAVAKAEAKWNEAGKKETPEVPQKRESGAVGAAATSERQKPMVAEMPVAESAAEAPVDVAEAPKEAAPQKEVAEAPVQELKVVPSSKAKPMMDGYRSESIVLKTDAGVKIPWRIAVEK